MMIYGLNFIVLVRVLVKTKTESTESTRPRTDLKCFQDQDEVLSHWGGKMSRATSGGERKGMSSIPYGLLLLVSYDINTVPMVIAI